MGDICLWSDGTWHFRDSMRWSDRFADSDHILLAEGTTEWFDFCISKGLI